MSRNALSGNAPPEPGDSPNAPALPRGVRAGHEAVEELLTALGWAFVTVDSSLSVLTCSRDVARSLDADADELSGRRLGAVVAELEERIASGDGGSVPGHTTILVRRPRVSAGPGKLTSEESTEMNRIRKALEATRYHRAEAAELLGISRTTLWRKMKQYRL